MMELELKHKSTPKSFDIERWTKTNKQIFDSIDKEESMLGKELLISHHLLPLIKTADNTEAKKLANFLFSRISKYNSQIYASLKKELQDSQKLLISRVEKSLKQEAYKEIFGNLKKTADKHFETSQEYHKKFKKDDHSTYAHVKLAMHHKEKAEELYDMLLAKDIKRVIRKIAIIKLTSTFKDMMLKSKTINKHARDALSLLRKNKKCDFEIMEIQRMIAEQHLLLRHFAINYSKSLIHSAIFVDHLKNKVVLYRHITA